MSVSNTEINLKQIKPPARLWTRDVRIYILLSTLLPFTNCFYGTPSHPALTLYSSATLYFLHCVPTDCSITSCCHLQIPSLVLFSLGTVMLHLKSSAFPTSLRLLSLHVSHIPCHSSSPRQAMADPLLFDDSCRNVFRATYTRSRAALHICLHLFIYNYAMLAMTTSLPPFIMPRILDFSIDVPHVISIIFPITAAFIAYLSASFIFAYVNIYAEKQLIPIPTVSKRTRDAYPMLSVIIIFAVAKEVVDNLGKRHAWIWTLRLCACCVVEAIFLYCLLWVCSSLFPKFGEGVGPLVEDYVETDSDIV